MIKTLGIFVGVILGISLLGLGIKFIFFAPNTAHKLIDTAIDAQDKVINADNAIYNYEWFKQQKQDIDGAREKYDNASITYDNYLQLLGDDRTTWDFEDKTELSRLSTIKLGIKNQGVDLVKDYNARASMATRNIFEDTLLPSFIDALTFFKQ